MKPFQVRCVDYFRSANGCAIPEGYVMPDIGDECTVINDFMENGKRYYSLAGYPKEFGYNAVCFAILPDQSADEMQEQEREGIVNIETV